MRSFRHPRWQHLDYRVKVATTQENKPPTQGTRQWTFTTPRWQCGSILLPSLNAGVPEPTGGNIERGLLTCTELGYTLWALKTDGNFQYLPKADRLRVPLRSPNGRQMAEVWAVLADCKTVYSPPKLYCPGHSNRHGNWAHCQSHIHLTCWHFLCDWGRISKKEFKQTSKLDQEINCDQDKQL